MQQLFDFFFYFYFPINSQDHMTDSPLSSFLFPGLWASYVHPPSFPPSKMELHPLSGDTGERGVDQEAALSRMWPPRPWGLKPAPIEPNSPVLKVVNWEWGLGRLRASDQAPDLLTPTLVSQDFQTNKDTHMHKHCFIQRSSTRTFQVNMNTLCLNNTADAHHVCLSPFEY